MRIYLAVTFWGEGYRRYFLDYCLASLLAPGNIAAITDKASARLLIATNDIDWAAMQAEPAFLAVKALIAIEHVPFVSRQYASGHEKMLVMSQAHRSLARRMFEDRANGIFLYPDAIMATGFISKLEELRRGGSKIVMFMNVRFANEVLIEELKQRELIKPGEALALPARELAALTIKHMHSELKRSGFDNSFDDLGCSSFFWPLPSGQDLVFHCGCWIPLLIDYESMPKHDDSTFTHSTLDGDYIARNMTDSKGVYFVHDTSELFMISFTPESSVHYSLQSVLRYRFPYLRTAIKSVNAHVFLYRQARMDWLAKEQFRFPVRFRGGQSPEWQWREVEKRSAAIVAKIETGGTFLDKLSFAAGFFARRATSRESNIFSRLCLALRMAWHYRRQIARRLRQAMCGDREAQRRAKWRLKQTGYYVFLGIYIAEPQL